MRITCKINILHILWEIKMFLANSYWIHINVFFLDEVVELPDLDYLRTMTHIVFVDFDNWSNFFGHLPGHLNQGTFIWGFQGMVNKENIWGSPPFVFFLEYGSL